jgi:hypothetical protein
VAFRARDPREVTRYSVRTRTLLLPGAWLTALATILWTARWPDPYLVHVRHIPPPHPYPTAGVLWVLGFATLEIVLLSVTLRPQSYSLSWRRALISLGIAIGFLCYGGLGAMHAPPYFFFYLWWLILLVVALLVLFIWSTSVSLRRRLDRRDGD